LKPAKFGYARPGTFDEALALLDEHGAGAKILAGGQSLVPMMNMRLARPDVLVDVNGLEGLDEIRADEILSIGALARQAAVVGSAEAGEAAPLLVDSLRYVGHPATRNRGTFGGMVAHADPAAEAPAVLLALGGEVVARSFGGTRTIDVDDLFRSYFTTSLAENELLVEIRLRIVANRRHAFLEVARRHGDFALVGLAATAETDGDGNCTAARLVFFGVGSTPVRARAAEELIVGRPLGYEPVVAEAARVAAGELAPAGDVHATGEYRREVAEVLARRALERLGEERAA